MRFQQGALTRLGALAAVAVAAALAGPSTAQAPSLTVVAGGGAAGGPALYLPNGDLLNVRNIQGGTLTDQRGSLNLDIGAGSTEHPGDVVTNYDVGRCLLVYGGDKALVASFCPNGIHFYKKVTYEASKEGRGRWRWRRYRRSYRVSSGPGGR